MVRLSMGQATYKYCQVRVGLRPKTHLFNTFVELFLEGAILEPLCELWEGKKKRMQDIRYFGLSKGYLGVYLGALWKLAK